MLQSHKDLIVWQKAVQFVVDMYSYTRSFPNDERFGMINQMRRAAVSIPSNIAEGRSRGTRKDFRNFLTIAYASCSELETQLILAEKLKFGDQSKASSLLNMLMEIQRMLKVMITSLGPRT